MTTASLMVDGAAPVVLASASAIRATMLRNAGIRVETMPARVDEHAIKASMRAEHAPPRDQADTLAELKAIRISIRSPGRLVIGADQVLAFDGGVIDKPADHAEARDQLERLSGEQHDLLSAAVIALDGEAIWRHVGRARLAMRRLSPGFIDRYLAAMGPRVLDTVGGYMLEAEGAQLFSRIDGDYFTVLGLPLLPVLGYLRDRGVLEA
ncbi:MAG: Maf family protein [Pseudomonadota bacterium]